MSADQPRGPVGPSLSTKNPIGSPSPRTRVRVHRLDGSSDPTTAGVSPPPPPSARERGKERDERDEPRPAERGDETILGRRFSYHGKRPPAGGMCGPLDGYAQATGDPQKRFRRRPRPVHSRSGTVAPQRDERTHLPTLVPSRFSQPRMAQRRRVSGGNLTGPGCSKATAARLGQPAMALRECPLGRPVTCGKPTDLRF